MAHTLVFHDHAAGRVVVRRYDDEGRLVGEEVVEARQVELRVPAVSGRGMGGGVVLYSVPGAVRLRRSGLRVVVEPEG
jgi:hypothetical protein